MGRPDYDDATAGGSDDAVVKPGDAIGWLQHGLDPDDVEHRGRHK